MLKNVLKYFISVSYYLASNRKYVIINKGVVLIALIYCKKCWLLVSPMVST